MGSSVHHSATGRTDTIDRLRQSLTDVLYAVAITPEVWRTRAPAAETDLEWLGEWSVAENLAHLAVYEECVAAPILESIAAGQDGSVDVITVVESDFEAQWQALSRSPLDDIARRLSTARERQVDAISSMDDVQFHALATTLWRDESAPNGHSAAWVAAKTFQHTWEHGNSIFRIALFAPA